MTCSIPSELLLRRLGVPNILRSVKLVSSISFNKWVGGRSNHRLTIKALDRVNSIVDKSQNSPNARPNFNRNSSPMYSSETWQDRQPSEHHKDSNEIETETKTKQQTNKKMEGRNENTGRFTSMREIFPSSEDLDIEQTAAVTVRGPKGIACEHNLRKLKIDYRLLRLSLDSPIMKPKTNNSDKTPVPFCAKTAKYLSYRKFARPVYRGRENCPYPSFSETSCTAGKEKKPTRKL